MKKHAVFLSFILFMFCLSCSDSSSKSKSTGSTPEVDYAPIYLVSADVAVVDPTQTSWDAAKLYVSQPVPEGDAADSKEEMLVNGYIHDTTLDKKYPFRGLYTPSLRQFTASVDIDSCTYQISYKLDEDNYFRGNFSVIVTSTNEYGGTYNLEGPAVAQ